MAVRKFYSSHTHTVIVRTRDQVNHLNMNSQDKKYFETSCLSSISLNPIISSTNSLRYLSHMARDILLFGPFIISSVR